MHQNAGEECIVGQHIRAVLEETFLELEEKAERQFRQTAQDRGRALKTAGAGASKSNTFLKVSD